MIINTCHCLFFLGGGGICSLSVCSREHQSRLQQEAEKRKCNIKSGRKDNSAYILEV